MARINLSNIKRVDKVYSHLHEHVQTTYSIVEINGNTYVQIDTYGKSTRDIPGKISQSLQIDKEAATFLVNILKEEFEI